MLDKYRGKLVLAGGAVLGIVAKEAKRGMDYDMFFVGVDADEAGAILDDVRAMFSSQANIVRTERAITFVFKRKLIIQIIMRLHANVGQVVVGFDLPPSKIAAWIDDDGACVVKCTPGWLECVRHMAFAVDLACWGRCSVARIFKYSHKGFDVFLPGNRRAALKPVGSWTDGLPVLLATEHAFLNRRRLSLSGRNAITKEEYAQIARQAFSCSDYDIVDRARHNIMHVVRTVMRLYQQIPWFLGGSSPRQAVAVAEASYKWARCDPRKKCMAAFNPSDPLVRHTYDLDRLVQIILG